MVFVFVTVGAGSGSAVTVFVAAGAGVAVTVAVTVAAGAAFLLAAVSVFVSPSDPATMPMKNTISAAGIKIRLRAHFGRSGCGVGGTYGLGPPLAGG
ncbi:hypothetical protein SAMN05444921_121192 [Streptomyces wuyuanensis]|uniref:Uncharacterized protein n=1 Tax=Streptomyces wuyuanensis TaxID=1196353 RepID=A0A1G9ZI69_9ACTN|nr:hypothetical protein SAMN05444921_121192 [Streptomyces wuyuanensis]